MLAIAEALVRVVWKTTVTEWITAISSALLVVAASVAAWIYNKQAKTMKRTAKEGAFFRIYDWYLKPENVEKRALVESRLIEPGDALSETVDEILGWFEYLAVLIKEGAIPEDTARRILGGSPVRIAVATHAYWLEKQNSRPQYARNLAAMVRHWQDNQMPDEPFGYGRDGPWYLGPSPEQDIHQPLDPSPHQADNPKDEDDKHPAGHRQAPRSRTKPVR